MNLIQIIFGVQSRFDIDQMTAAKAFGIPKSVEQMATVILATNGPVPTTGSRAVDTAIAIKTSQKG